MKENYKQQALKFKNLLIEMCFDSDYSNIEDDEDYYRIKASEFDGWQEIFCRWLYKYGYIDKDKEKNQWKLKGEQNGKYNR